MTQQFRKTFLGVSAVVGVTIATTALAQGATGANDPATLGQPTIASDAKLTEQSWESLDIDKDGNVNRTEATANSALQVAFPKADVNADGVLSGEEYKAYLTTLEANPGAVPKEQQKKK